MKKKFMRPNRYIHDPLTHTTRVSVGENIIHDLIRGNSILIPIVFDQHGNLGPIAQAFLSTSNTTIPPITIRPTHPNAQTMHHRATTHPSPTGILHAADAMWKLNPTRRYYGFSHTAPTPQLHTLQQLGLGITKAYGIHLRNCTSHNNPPTPNTYPHQPQPTHTRRPPTIVATPPKIK